MEASKNIVPFALYDPVRKQGFLGCIKQCIQNKLPGIEEKYQLNFALKLWSGCLATAKTIALGTQTGKNTAQFRSEMIPRIDTTSTKDMIYRKGRRLLVFGSRIQKILVSTAFQLIQTLGSMKANGLRDKKQNQPRNARNV